MDSPEKPQQWWPGKETTTFNEQTGITGSRRRTKWGRGNFPSCRTRPNPRILYFCVPLQAIKDNSLDMHVVHVGVSFLFFVHWWNVQPNLLPPPLHITHTYLPPRTPSCKTQHPLSSTHNIPSVSPRQVSTIEDFTKQWRSTAAEWLRFHIGSAPTSPAYKMSTYHLPLQTTSIPTTGRSPHRFIYNTPVTNSLIMINSVLIMHQIHWLIKY
jgi:hypothetical protein